MWKDYSLNIHHNASLYSDGLTNGFLKCQSLKMKTCKLINRAFFPRIFLSSLEIFVQAADLFSSLYCRPSNMKKKCWKIILTELFFLPLAAGETLSEFLTKMGSLDI